MRIIVTAGPTREYIDPVRFISNASSGKMGYAVAACAASAGHEVTLISGPVALATPPGVRRVDIVSVADLQRALSEAFPWADALVMSAAVGDFTVESPSDRKISRKGGPITVRLVPTADILAGRAVDFRLEPRDLVYVSDRPWSRVEDLADMAATAFIQTMVTVWTGGNVGPFIRSPIIPSIK